MPSIGVNLRVTGHCSQGGRKYMEDFFSVAYQQSLSDERDLEYAFIGIYDGHGGAEAATYAKEHLINLIVNQKQFWSDDDQDVLRAIREGYIATHYAMWREQGKWPKTASGLPSTAGTTASVAFIRHGKIYIGHVGDSGIVLGYQNDNERVWRAKPLTVDHKPESEEERTRIMKSGGKVVNKAGVPRVVWNRPRIGHKGPVRRSTLIDEIPFLAVARSLGDLWSYNSDMDEFVVSPEPDVRVVKIDPKRFKCLVFGTDGLWNVVTPQAAIDSVRYTETLNEHSACESESKEWVNPSKYLVDKALERWSTRKMRADNTSVVIVMLDPPGPPKRDVLKSSAPTYSMDYLEEDIINQQSQALEIEPIQNFTMFDHSTNEHIDMDGMPLPTSGLTVLTRYENITESDVQKHNHQQAYENVMDVDNENDAMDVDNENDNEPYLNTFAESYNSIMNSSLNDQYIYDNGNAEKNDEDEYQFDDANTTHQYNGERSSSESIYSLTKLQTRGEQQRYDIYGGSMSSDPIPSTSKAMHESYQQNLADHCYVAPTSVPISSDKTSPSTKRSLSEGLASTFLSMVPSILRSRFPSSRPSTNSDIKSDSDENVHNTERPTGKIDQPDESDDDKNATNADEVNETIDINESDNSIQINEISSSDSNGSMNNNDAEHATRSKKLLITKKNESSEQHASIASRKATRSATTGSAFASTARITRSTGNSRKTRPVIISKITKSKNYVQKQPNTKTNGTRRVHKENIADIVRKLPLESIISCTMTRTKKIVTSNQGTTSRTLRSQNVLTKDQSNKASIQRSTQNQAHSANIQSSSSSGNKSCRSKINIIGNAKVIVCKKPPKRLLNDSVQNKSNNNHNNSNKSQKLSMSPTLHGTNKKSDSTQQSSPLRWKVLVTKKPLIANHYNQLVSEVNRSTMTTRRTRFQQ